MRKLLIVGAWEFGREVFAWIYSSPRFLHLDGIRDVGFLDDGRADTVGRGKIVGPVSGHVPVENNIYLCTIGNPATRKKV